MAIKTSYYGGGLQYFRYDSYEIINNKTYSVTSVDLRHLGLYANHNNEKYIEVAGLKEFKEISVDYEVLIFHGSTQVGKISNYYYVNYEGNTHLARIDIDERFIPYVNPNGITTFKTNVVFGDWEPGGSTPYYLDSGIWLTSDSDVDLIALSNMQINPLDVDEQISVTWQSTNNSQMQLWVENSGGSIVYEKHLLNANSHNIPIKTFPPGNYKFNIQPYADYAIKTPVTREFGKLGTKTSQSLTLVQKAPKILTLEPDNIPQNKDADILVNWTSENQQEFELRVKLDGVLVKTYTGTTEKYINITKGTLNTGNAEITLTIKYMPTWGTKESDKRTTTKTVTFLAFGKPTTPTITSNTTFDTSRPTITWTFDDEQVAFQVSVFKGDILVADSGIIYGVMTSYKLAQSLENNTSYTIRLKIRNQYNEFSDEATQTITISYDILQAPTFFIRANNEDGSIIIDITNPTQEHLAYCEIYRKSDNEEWIRVAKDLGQNDSFTDYGLITKKIYDYKVRAISSQEGFTDSEPKKCSTILNYTQLIDVNDNGKILALRYSPNKTFNFNKPTYTMDYVGRRGISVEYARKQYNSMNCGFTIRDNELNLFLDLFSSGNTLLYRDNRGFKIYGHIINEPQIKIVNNGWCDISFMFVESDYSEVV